MEAEEIDAIVRTGRRRLLFAPQSTQAVDLRRAEIEKLVPHREPFLLLDCVTAIDVAGSAIAGTRRIAPDDPLFRGHFPHEPVYPGVLQVEIMGQLGLCLMGLLKTAQNAGTVEVQPPQARFIKIHHAVFLAAVRPGDALIVLAKLIESNGLTAVCAGQIVTGDTICAFAVMEVYLVQA